MITHWIFWEQCFSASAAHWNHLESSGPTLRYWFNWYQGGLGIANFNLFQLSDSHKISTSGAWNYSQWEHLGKLIYDLSTLQLLSILFLNWGDRIMIYYSLILLKYYYRHNLHCIRRLV